MSAKRNKDLLPDTKIAGCACAGNAGNVFPANRLQRKPLVNNPDMHHGTCVTHVPWCMSGSLTRGGRENVPDIPGACATHNFAYLVRSPLQLTLNGERVSMRFHRHDGQLSNLSLNNVLVIIHDTVLSSVSNVYFWCQYGTQHGSLMMTSSNGNIFRVTGPLCGEFTGPGEFPTQRPVTRSFDVFFDLRLNERLSKQPWGWGFETPS